MSERERRETERGVRGREEAEEESVRGERGIEEEEGDRKERKRV